MEGGFTSATTTINPLDLDSGQDKTASTPPHQSNESVRSPTCFANDVQSAHDYDLVTWDGPDDPANPQNWSQARKILVILVGCLLSFNVTFASTAPTAGGSLDAQDFGTSPETSYLVTTMVLAGYVFGPLLWGPGSEVFGRRPVFVLTTSAYTILHLGQSLANNMITFSVTRFLSGVFAVAPLTNCGGLIADLWGPTHRGPATSLVMGWTFLGSCTGPVIGGLVIQSGLGWRWIFWIMMIFAFVCMVITIFCLPETFAPILLQKKAIALRRADPVANKHLYAAHEKADWSIESVLKRTVFRAFYMLSMEPILVLITIYLTLSYSILYALFEAFPVVFVETRGFNSAQNGLMFIAVGIGISIGALITAYLSWDYEPFVVKWKGSPPPEKRLYGAMIAGPCFVVGIFWFGWSGHYASVPWYIPALSLIPLGASITLLFISFFTYIIDTYMMFSASALAGHTIIRSAVSAAFPLFTVQMFTKLGSGWASTILGLVGLILAPSPFLFHRYGTLIRSKSKFAPCHDLRIAAEIRAEEKQWDQVAL
ncbi:MFS polyamine transporter [Phlebopus sp. FC_14]|nr:MFS polyamine transporter [Phlebopus sp. FC_14]